MLTIICLLELMALLTLATGCVTVNSSVRAADQVYQQRLRAEAAHKATKSNQRAEQELLPLASGGDLV